MCRDTRHPIDQNPQTHIMLSSPPAASPEPPPDPKRRLDSPSATPKPPKSSRPPAARADDEDGEDAGEEEELGIMCRNPRIQRYLIAVEYVGTLFSGSAPQPNRRTVVGALEDAFHKFVGQPVSVICSSRTDAGVHALANVCHVDVERISKRMPGEVLPPHETGVVRRAINHFLQKEDDVKLIDVRCVPPDFHARHKALERTYFYRLLTGPEPLSTFEKNHAWHVPEELDLLAMKKACSILVGHHDFSSFRASGCQAKSPVKTLDELHVCEVVPSLYFPSCVERRETKPVNGLLLSFDSKELESSSELSSASQIRTENIHEFGQRPRHRCYVITARAQSFLYHQVRLLVGVLKDVGTGKLSTTDAERILDAKTVTAASPMAPAYGLYLGNVKYDI